MAGKRPFLKVRLNGPAVWKRLGRHNISQNDLARHIGVTSGYFSLLVNGKRCPSPSTRQRLQDVLVDAEFDELFIVEQAEGE